MDRNLREQLRDQAYFDRTAEFCTLYDSQAFDPEAETLALSEFEPLLRRVLAKPVNTLYKSALESA